MCNKCNKNYPIVNKKYGLCNGCNFKRTHEGQSQQEVYSERAKERTQTLYAPSHKKYRIKQQTTKDAGIKRVLSIVKSEIENDALQNDEYYCQGCGRADGALDKSHLLSVGKFKHLELVKENMQLMCRKCHNKWETGVIATMIELLCFVENMKIIRTLDHSAFLHLSNKLQEYEQTREKCDY